jgi:DNA segregation ATPase FtsK/SpoIIIE, S-DNA-T family
MRKSRSRQVHQQRIIKVLNGLAFSAVLLLGLFKTGPVGIFIDLVFTVLFGGSRVLTYLILFTILPLITIPHPFRYVRKSLVLPIFGFYISLLMIFTLEWSEGLTGTALFSSFITRMSDFMQVSEYAYGGIFIVTLTSILTGLVDIVGTWIIISLLFLASCYVIVITYVAPNASILKIFKFRPKQKTKHNPMITLFDEPPREETKKSVFVSVDEGKPKDRYEPVVHANPQPEIKTQSAGTLTHFTHYVLPSLALLDIPQSRRSNQINAHAAGIKGKKLIEILDKFQIPAELVQTYIGPSVTKFEVKPDSSIKISKIAALADNIKMELQAKDIRIEAPIPGKNAVGVEVPNVEMSMVRLIELMRTIPKEKENKKLLFLLGKDLMGKTIVGELDKMPHLLIAGATGSGKSVCVNSLITTLLLRTSPHEVKLLLVDPKKVEFTAFHDIPHLIAPVISDAGQAAKALKTVVALMENRYEVFATVGVRNITSYNEKVLAYPEDHLSIMPYIVVIVDELADLMMVAGKEVESSIQRITQLARAAGIHLVVATQRPSTDVITGIIKANIPSRIAFAVSSSIDSRTILDFGGAEKLLGNGDMLYMPIGETANIRVQGVFISDDEVNKIAQAAKAQGKPMYDDAFINLEGVDHNDGFINISDDPLYEDVKLFIIQSNKASTSLIQRRFSLGYNRAARLMDLMEQEGIIGPPNGSKPREILRKDI